MDLVCAICDRAITSDLGHVQEKGLSTISSISIQLGDMLHKKLEKINLPIPIHVNYRKDYTRPSSTEHRKRRELADSSDTCAPATLRSSTPVFNIKSDCLYCAEPVIDYKGNESKIPHKRGKRSHSSETKPLLQSVILKADERKDEWGAMVKLRLQTVSDIIAAERKYHHDCQVRFHSGKEEADQSGGGQPARGRPSGSVDPQKHKTFMKLCDYLEHIVLAYWRVSLMVGKDTPQSSLGIS